MNKDARSIVLIAKDPAVSADVAAALRGIPNVTVHERPSTLSEMNGTVVKLAGAHDVVIFRTDAVGENDLAAISALRKALPKGVLLALADADISLADARSLTRAGVHEVLPYPVSAEEMQEHVARWAERAPAEPATRTGGGAGRLGRVIAVSQARGGVGATTVAVNLADRLLDRGGLLRKTARNRVALVDLDIQFGAVASFLDLAPNDALYELAMNGAMPDDSFLQQSLAQLPSGLSVLPAPARFAPMEALRGEQVSRIVDLLRAQYDYVVIDLPRTLVEWVGPVLSRTDRLLLVTDSAVPSVRQARRLMDFYLDDNPALAIDVVINNEKKPMMLRRHHAEAARVLERPLETWIPYDPVAAREAIDRGAPLSAAAGRSQLAKGIGALGRRMLKQLEGASALQKKTA